MDLHDRLRQWRESKGLTQDEVARALDTSLQSYSRYERGVHAPKAAHLLKLAEMGCDPTWLVTGISAGGRSNTTDAHDPLIARSNPARVDRDLWRALRAVVKELYTAEGVKLPETVMDDIMISKYNILEQYIAAAPPTLTASDKLDEALRMIRIQLREEMALDHPDASTSKHRA